MAKKIKISNSNKKFNKIFFFLSIYLLIVTILLSMNGGFISNLVFFVILLLIMLTSVLFFLAFFGQFVLPVINLSERIKSVQRILYYIAGNHGPAFFIENGELRERKIERSKTGPGVIILDTASAALIRSPVKYKGAIGPGIAFTEKNDLIAGIVDLHIQSQSVGPRMEEDPFAPIQKGETSAAFEARMTRRNETLAITRDGIQLCANITVRFKIDANPGEGNTAFGYNSSSVEKAIIGQSINFEKPDDNPDRIISWKWYPVNLTIDIFREYISKYTTNELFPLLKSEANILDLITKQIKTRLTQSHYYLLDNFGNELSETEFSKEFHLLKQRGIRFLDLIITNLRFPAQIEESLQSRWKSSWLEVATKEKKLTEKQHSMQIIEGQNHALMDFAYGSTKYLGSYTTNQVLSQKEIIISLLKGNLDTISQDTELSINLKNEYKDISDLIEWVRSQGDLS